MWVRERRSERAANLSDLGVLLRSGRGNGPVSVTSDTALRNSAVWACLRIRADMISTFPCNSYRDVGGISVSVPKAPVLVEPGGKFWKYGTWMWAKEFELGRSGNAVGLITERNALGLPARIELQPASSVRMYQKRDMPEHRYIINGKEYSAAEVWHERDFPVPGMPIGLSPVAYAAWTLSEALSMQQFALDWFAGGGVPKARLHNTKKSLESGPDKNEARRVKDRYMATVANGDIFVHGHDWELDFLQGQHMGVEWLDGRRATIPDLARFFGCPVDLIDAAIDSPGSITYQSGLQRNLQFLVMHLAPAVVRRQDSLSDLLPRPRFVRLNTNSLLRMDPETQAKVIHQRITDRTLTPTEARELYDQPPLTAEQIAEFTTLFGAPRTQPAAAKAGAPDPDERRFYEQVSPLSAIPYPHPADALEVAP
jgi:HK97 family phage portal protein